MKRARQTRPRRPHPPSFLFASAPPTAACALCMRSVALFLTLACIQALGQLVLRVNDGPPHTISAADLTKLPRVSAVMNDHGKQIAYQGVLLHDLLAKGGVDFGATGIRGKQLSSYVAALAGDGYEVIYALAEFDPTIVDSGIVIADTREGQALDAKEGPLRIVVPHDKRPTRCLRLLKEIDVVQLKQ